MVEKEKLSRLAEVVFKENGQLQITGQGTLKRVFLSAHLSEEADQILPPKEHYFFHKNIHTTVDEALVAKVRVYFILSQEEAIEYVHQWEAGLIKQTAQQSVRFGDFGYFQFGDSLGFEASSLLYYEWLPSLEYVKSSDLPRDLPGKVLVMQTLKTASNGGEPDRVKKKNPVIMPAMWAVLLVLFLFSFTVWLEPVSLLFESEVEVNRKLVNVAPKSYNPSEDYYIYSDTETTTDELLTDPERDGNDDHDVISSAGNLLPDKELESPRAEKEDHALIADEEINEAAGETMPCTLIVGAFAERHNMDRMAEMLEDMDLEVVRLERRTITLIGARVDCKDQSRISSIKTNVEPDAWIYKN